MTASNQFSNVTMTYLSEFYNILDDMIQNMTAATLTDSISNNFIAQMIPHHEAAIAMSRNLLQYTTCVPLENIAANIIEEQTASIANMQNILDQCRSVTNTGQELALYQRHFRQITSEMFSKMENSWTSNNINGDFIREMIPHHRGAIQMAKSALQYNICPKLTPILQAIITSQEESIKRMQRLICCM